VPARRRIRLTVAAGIALLVFVLIWAAFLGSGQCGNEDTVECTPLGWVLLYGWMAMAVFTFALVVLVLVLWAAEASRHMRRRRARQLEHPRHD
jgi:integral membrane sensor domain MASE1